MTCRVQASGTIELFFYGELPHDERTAVREHLKHCSDCRQTLDDLTVIRAALASRPDVATPPDGDWSGFMRRLAAATDRQAVADQPASQVHGRRVLRMPLGRQVVIALATAALLAIVTVSVLLVAGKDDAAVSDEAQFTAVATAPSGSAPAAVQAPAARQPDPALVSLSGSHFERSKLVVLGLATRDSSRPGAADWSHERELAASLLRDTRLYRVAAEERGMTTLAGVMRDLELVLLQTSMSVEPDTAALEQLQRLIRRRDLLTKMNTVGVAGP
jgi:hypothetical protein